MCFPSRRGDLHIPIIIFHQHFSRHKLCDFDKLLSLSHHRKLCATTDLLSCAISGHKINQPLAVDLRNCDVLGHYSTFIPFQKQSSANCSRWNITASSLLNLAASSFRVFRLLTDFVCLYNYEFWLSLCKIVRSSVICYYPYLSCVGFHATKKNCVIPRNGFSDTPSPWQVFNVSSFSHSPQKFLDCSTVDACHTLHCIARKTFIWQN
jgi:hypothetical protein